MSATKAPHAYKTFFISSLPSSSELEYYGFYGPNSVTLQQQSGRNIRFLGAMLNTQKVPAALRRALHKRDLFSAGALVGAAGAMTKAAMWARCAHSAPLELALIGANYGSSTILYAQQRQHWWQ
jgi:hypothetical protein